MSTDHFEGKSVPEHLKQARLKGALVAKEVHGRELSGAFAAGIDSAKETSLLLALLALLIPPTWPLVTCLFAGWLVWKVGRSACLGWARLERLHRMIEEERFEIEHHRDQEKQELTEMYAAKGFDGKMLDEIIETLMADDNRLLMVMLEEELGIAIESYEHPLRQAIGAAFGVVIAFGLAGLGFWAFPLGVSLSAIGVFLVASVWAAKRERNHRIKAVIWNLAVGLLAYGAAYFVHEL